MNDERMRTVMALAMMLAGSSCVDEPMDADRAIEPGPAQTRPIALEDPQDVHRRAVLAIEQRIEREPSAAAHREVLIRWKEDQILLDDMAEAAPLTRSYPLGQGGAR